MSSSSSSDGGLEFALLSGGTSPGANVIASFRVGDNSMRPDGVPEFMLGGDSEHGSTPAGHITWDAGYGGAGGDEFFSVAPVRLRMDTKEIRWSVGTTDFISRASTPFRRVRKVQVVAAVDAGDVPDAQVRWDMLEVSFGAPGCDGVRTHKSPCLPRAWSHVGLRRGEPRAADTAAGARQQYAEIVGPHGSIGSFELRGQITLLARRHPVGKTALPPDGLMGKVLIFTE